MKNSLERRILIFSLLALTLTVAANTGFNVESFRRSYRDGILQRAHTFATALKSQVEAVVILGLPLDEIDGISERCQDIVNNDPEISFCLIEDSSGTILYYNKEYPQTAEVDYVGNLSSEVSILESKTMGKIYDHASLLFDYDDKVVGRVRIGFQDKILNQLVLDHLGSTVLVLIAAFAAAFAMIVIFARYDLVLPIRIVDHVDIEYVTCGGLTEGPDEAEHGRRCRQQGGGDGHDAFGGEYQLGAEMPVQGETLVPGAIRDHRHHGLTRVF